jgi:hypothetical protein
MVPDASRHPVAVADRALQRSALLVVCASRKSVLCEHIGRGHLLVLLMLVLEGIAEAERVETC